MAFGINRAQIIGRLGADVVVNHLASGGRVANLSIATDESYINRQTGEKVDRTEWHRIVTFQDGLIDMFQKHAVKGRLVYVEGKLQTRRWSKPGEDGDRFSTEILLCPAGGCSSSTGRTATARRRRPTPRRCRMPPSRRTAPDSPPNSRTIRKSRSSGHIVSSRLGRRFARRPSFLAADPEPGPTGLRALRRRREAEAGRYRASRMH